MCGGNPAGKLMSCIEHSKGCGNAQMGEDIQGAPHLDLAAQPAPQYEADQHSSW